MLYRLHPVLLHMQQDIAQSIGEYAVVDANRSCELQVSNRATFPVLVELTLKGNPIVVYGIKTTQIIVPANSQISIGMVFRKGEYTVQAVVQSIKEDIDEHCFSDTEERCLIYQPDNSFVVSHGKLVDGTTSDLGYTEELHVEVV